MRLLVCVALLVGCETTNTLVTRRVATLGYAAPPAVIVVTRGDEDLGRAWAADLRAAPTATVVGELRVDGDDRVEAAAAAICDRVRTSVGEQHVDEIVVLDAVREGRPEQRCLREVCDPRPPLPKHDHPPSCRCIRWEYRRFAVTLATRASFLQASSCRLVETTTLPTVTAASDARPPLAYGSKAEVAEVLAADEAAAQGAALETLRATIDRVDPQRWALFPRTSPTVRPLERGTFEVVDAPLVAGREYWIKPPREKRRARRRDPAAALTKARVAKADGRTAVLETTGRPIEARDELHATDDYRRNMLYATFAGGAVRGEGETHGLGNAALASRFTFDVMPVMFEARLEGELAPGFELARWTASGAFGFRYRVGPVAPVAFAEVGLAKAYQPGGSAFGVLGGLAAGVELTLGRWVLLADARRRHLYLDDWERDGMPADVRFADTSWRSTSVHVGVGARF